MSIILKGIDKKDILKNEKCIFQTYDWNCGKVCFLGLIMECSTALPCEPNKRAEKCPIIQIPKGHGRLIDENEAIRGWCKGCAFNDGTCGKDETICEDKEMCKYAPTILEAEETNER